MDTDRARKAQPPPRRSFWTAPLPELSLPGLATMLLALALACLVVVNTLDLAHPLLEDHGFRQTQTALTAYYLKLNGFSLRYETPVVGEPWAIPFEFPLYQAIVAAISWLAATPLSATGRVVSLLFALLTCIPVHGLLSRLKMDRTEIHFSLALYASTPVYLFWSGSFMIESTALFLACCFSYYGLKVVQKAYSDQDLLLLCVFLGLASLQKITTALPCATLFAGACLMSFKSRPRRPRQLLEALKIAGSLTLALAAGVAWTHFTDEVKLQNPIGATLTSAKLAQWNFGTLEQRFSSQLWVDTVYARLLIPGSLFGFGPLLMLPILFTPPKSPQRRVLACCAFLFLLPLLLFPNLHIVHNYYQTAIALYLAIATATGIVFSGRRYLAGNTWAQGSLMVLALIANLLLFLEGPFSQKTRPIPPDDRRLVLTDYIRTHTPPDRPVIWLGHHWSSEYAYYSERRSLTIPGPGEADWEVAAIEHPDRFLSQPPAAVVMCPIAGREEQVRSAIARHYKNATLRHLAGCEIYLL